MNIKNTTTPCYYTFYLYGQWGYSSITLDDLALLLCSTALHIREKQFFLGGVAFIITPPPPRKRKKITFYRSYACMIGGLKRKNSTNTINFSFILVHMYIVNLIAHRHGIRPTRFIKQRNTQV